MKRHPEVEKYLRKRAVEMNKARNKKLSPQRRKEIAKRAGEANKKRWEIIKKNKKTT